MLIGIYRTYADRYRYTWIDIKHTHTQTHSQKLATAVDPFESIQRSIREERETEESTQKTFQKFQ